jgi:uncharacterized RDD family membrane protein YckC
MNDIAATSAALPLQYASVTRRAFALLLDCLILVIPALLISVVIPVVGIPIAWFLYAPVLESSPVRATLGKHLLGLQVTDLEGRQLDLKTSLLRSLVKLISSPLFFFGCFFAFFTARKQALHDLVTQTVTIHGQYEGSIFDAWIGKVQTVFGSGKAAA